MSYSHDRTLLAKFGFADPDKKLPRHDLACAYVKARASVIAQRIVLPTPEETREIQERCRCYQLHPKLEDASTWHLTPTTYRATWRRTVDAVAYATDQRNRLFPSPGLRQVMLETPRHHGGDGRRSAGAGAAHPGSAVDRRRR
jgi:hypothetical protein